MLSKIFIGYFICMLKMVLSKARGEWEWFEDKSEFSKNKKEEITFQIAC